MDEAILWERATLDNPEPAWSRMQRVVRGKGHEHEIACYGKWSEFYDEDMIVLGFNGYEDTRMAICEVLPEKSAKILDLGCGTGQMGEKLSSTGYDNIYGIDATPGFIKTASDKNVYRKLDVVDLDGNTTTPYDDGFFDVVIGIGVFGPDCIDQRAFPEIHRIIRPGGFLVGYIRKSRLEMETEKFNIKAAFESFVDKRLWTRFPDKDTRNGFFPEEKQAGLPVDIGIVVTIQKS